MVARPTPRRSRRLLLAVGLGVLAAAAICGGLRLAGPSEHQTALGRVAVTFAPAVQGEMVFFTPLADWGVSAPAFRAPAQLRIEPRALDRQALAELAGRPGPLLASAERDLRGAVLGAAWQALFWVGIAGALLLPLGVGLARRLGFDGRWGLGVPLGAMAASLCVAGLAAASFDPSAFERPTYWARGGELPQLVEFVGQARRAGGSYRSSVAHGLRELATVLRGGRSGLPAKNSALLLSDLHNNVLVLPALRRLAANRPVFFAGDFTHDGGPGEAQLLLPQLRGLGQPLIAVSGNHDSLALMRALAGGGAVVLTERGRLRPDGSTDGRPLQQLQGLRVMGFADPLQGGEREQPGRPLSLDAAQQQQWVARWARLVRRWRPQLLLVHQAGLADALARQLADLPLTILTGHDHRQRAARYGRVVTLNAGTAGAGGVLGAGRQEVGFARLYFTDAQLVAADLIRTEPLRGTGQAQRVAFDLPCQRQENLCLYSDQRSADLP